MKLQAKIFFFAFIISVFSISGVVFAASYSKDTHKAQIRLKALGYNPGIIDGVWGKKTENAIKKYQEDNGLNVSGSLDAATKEKLDLASVELPKRSLKDLIIQEIKSDPSLNGNSQMLRTVKIKENNGYVEISANCISYAQTKTSNFAKVFSYA